MTIKDPFGAIVSKDDYVITTMPYENVHIIKRVLKVTAKSVWVTHFERGTWNYAENKRNYVAKPIARQFFIKASEEQIKNGYKQENDDVRLFNYYQKI